MGSVRQPLQAPQRRDIAIETVAGIGVLIHTDFTRAILANDGCRPRRMSLTPLRRAGEPAEVAGAALSLASAAGGFVTGHNLVVDGRTVISDGN